MEVADSMVVGRTVFRSDIRIENGSITPAYIQYLWVRQQNANTNNKIIYIPTEAGLPVLEAGRVAGKEKE